MCMIAAAGSDSAVHRLSPCYSGGILNESYRLAVATVCTQHCHASRTVKGVNAYLSVLSHVQGQDRVVG